MTRPEHYREAERLLARAEEHYLDDSDDAAPRSAYDSEAAWLEALREGQEAHAYNVRLATLFASMATAHATLATALPAPALSAPQRVFLLHALELAADAMASNPDQYGEDDEAALESLRALAAAPATEDGAR